MNATLQIMNTLQAMGAKPTGTKDDQGNDIIKVNAPEITAKSCETCARRETCTRDTGIVYGFCNTDYKREVKQCL